MAGSSPAPRRRALTALHRAAARHRRLLAAGLAAASVAVGLTALAPAPPDTVAVLVAARDLPGGHRLADPDLTTVQLPPDAVPDGALVDPGAVRGRVVASPLRRHEPVTDVRVLAPALVSAQDGDVVATPLRIADPDVVALLHPGDRVDVLGSPDSAPVAAATDDGAAPDGDPADRLAAPADAAPATASRPGPALVVARDVLVLAALTSSDDDALAAGTSGGLLVLQTSRPEAAAVVAAAAAGPVAVVLRPR